MRIPIRCGAEPLRAALSFDAHKSLLQRQEWPSRLAIFFFLSIPIGLGSGKNASAPAMRALRAPPLDLSLVTQS